MDENRKQQLMTFIDSCIKGDSEAASAAFQPYIAQKSKEILNVNQQATIKESIELLNEFDETSPIKLRGNDVTVNGKVVGTIKNDLNDFDSGINFSTADGSFSKEFNTIQDLYSFLSNKYIGNNG